MFICHYSDRMSLPLATSIEVTPQTGLPSRSNSGSPVPGVRRHFESDSDSDSESEQSILGDKFITRYVIILDAIRNRKEGNWNCVCSARVMYVVYWQ